MKIGNLDGRRSWSRHRCSRNRNRLLANRRRFIHIHVIIYSSFWCSWFRHRQLLSAHSGFHGVGNHSTHHSSHGRIPGYVGDVASSTNGKTSRSCNCRDGRLENAGCSASGRHVVGDGDFEVGRSTGCRRSFLENRGTVGRAQTRSDGYFRSRRTKCSLEVGMAGS